MPIKLEEVLARAKSVGFLGPGPIREHIDHAEVFAQALNDHAASDRVSSDRVSSDRALSARGAYRFADIGAGGGVPSLPILVANDQWTAVLMDSSQKRCSFLVWASTELGLADRVEVWCGRVEQIAHDDRARFMFDAVIARGFGPPASTIECGVGLLVEGGRLIISEPPGQRRWPAAELDTVGLAQRSEPGRVDGVAVFERVGLLDQHLPRNAKQQRSRPLFTLP